MPASLTNFKENGIDINDLYISQADAPTVYYTKTMSPAGIAYYNYESGKIWSYSYSQTGEATSPYLGNTWIDVGAYSYAYNYSAGEYRYYFGAIKSDGTLWSFQNTTSPVQIGSSTSWTKIAMGGSNNSLVVNTSKDAYLYNPSSSSSTLPTLAGTGPFEELYYSVYGGVAGVKTNGTLWTWGGNSFGQLGLGDITDRQSPTQVGSLTNWKQASGGGIASGAWMYAVKTDGTLWKSGSDYYGIPGPTSSPVQVGALTNWKQVACNRNSTVAVKTDGTLWVWGYNNGTLGLGDTTNRNSPVQVGTQTDWKLVSAGEYMSWSALKTNNTLWTVNNSSPVQIGTAENWKKIPTTTTGVALS